MVKKTSKKGKKGKKGSKKAAGQKETASGTLKRLLKLYEQNCEETGAAVSTSLKQVLREAIDMDRLLVKIIIEGVPQQKSEDLPVTLGPLLTAIRQERYVYMQQLYVWDLAMLHQDVTALALMLEKGIYPLKHLELMDCLIEADGLKRLSLSFNTCLLLTEVILDYNEFGDTGCNALCYGLNDNTVLLTLSLCYCDLGPDSGQCLSNIICNTAVRNLYLDGNNLECAGAMALIDRCVTQAENEMDDENDEKEPQEEQSAIVTGRGKKRKKKESRPPPLPGPWLHKLHLVDNCIDTKPANERLSPLMCMQLFARFISKSRCLVEIDLDDNLIGELGGSELLAGLQKRDADKLPSMKLRTTHRLQEETFKALVELGGGLKKKKKGKRKKK